MKSFFSCIYLYRLACFSWFRICLLINRYLLLEVVDLILLDKFVSQVLHSAVLALHQFHKRMFHKVLYVFALYLLWLALYMALQFWQLFILLSIVFLYSLLNLTRVYFGHLLSLCEVLRLMKLPSFEFILQWCLIVLDFDFSIKLLLVSTLVESFYFCLD